MFKTPNAPAPKTTRFLFGGRRMPFKGKGYNLQVSVREKSLMKSSECQNFSTGFPPKRFPAVELGWPVECRVSGSIRPPHPHPPPAEALARPEIALPRGPCSGLSPAGTHVALFTLLELPAAIARRRPGDLIKRFPPPRSGCRASAAPPLSLACLLGRWQA